MNANFLNKTLARPAKTILKILNVDADGEGSQVAYLRPYTANLDTEPGVKGRPSISCTNLLLGLCALSWR